MSTHRSRRIDRATAEQLLAGARSQAPGTPGASDVSESADSHGPSDRHEALAGLLAAAAAPAGKNELSGEPEALAMFRTARLAASAVPASGPASASASASGPVPASSRRSLPTPATLLGAKVAAAVLAAALGGVAVAAGTGSLPTILGSAPEHALPASSPTPNTLLADAPPPGASPAPSPGASGRSSEALPADLPADLAELCRAFTRAPGPRPEEVLAERRFTALVAAAGGRSGVRDYCAPVQGGEPEPSASAPTRNPRAATPKHPGKADPSRRPVTPGPSAGQHGPRTRPPGPPARCGGCRPGSSSTAG
ncbi:hypothetical protein [Streptomyces sp. NBC_01244]|uniref:hypothetical protein n=1 Tax=Streptomyces sp. NBC_01244 TaxID=2903797 RepID=UPI002E11C0DA|nr:hypothetical protein OG247_33810 [Streptomyces sp. NBC_01244]